MNIELKPMFRFELSAVELTLIIRGLKSRGTPEALELLDKISRMRLQQVENYAKQLSLNIPDDGGEDL